MARTSRADRRIAIHEAGHVVAAWWVGRDVWSATIVPSEVAKAGEMIAWYRGSERMIGD